jgi:hypothetical protein
MMRAWLTVILALCISQASAEAAGRSTAIMVMPIHGAQVVRGDDGLDTSSTNCWSSMPLRRR